MYSVQKAFSLQLGINKDRLPETHFAAYGAQAALPHFTVYGALLGGRLVEGLKNPDSNHRIHVRDDGAVKRGVTRAVVEMSTS